MTEESEKIADHIHVYAIKGTGPSCWAECACGEKLDRGNGAVIGSRQTMERIVGSL